MKPFPLKCNVNLKCRKYHCHIQYYNNHYFMCIVYFSDAQCTATAPDNGAIVGGVTSIADGADATYECSSGFTLDGTSPLTCTAGMLGTGIEPTCKAGTIISFHEKNLYHINKIGSF